MMKKFFDEARTISISPNTIVFTVFFILGLFFLYLIRDIVFTVFLALILMSALHPSLRWMEQKLRMPRFIGIVILYLLIIAFLALSISLILPPLIAEAPNLIQSLHLPNLPSHINSFQFSLTELNSFLSELYGSFGTIFSILTSTFSGILSFLTVLVMTAYMLLDSENLHKKVMWFTRDKKHLDLAAEFVTSLEIQLGGWVRGQLVLMFTIGLMAFIGLSLLQVPYALPLALASGLLEILPNLGPAIAAIPGIVIAYTSMGPAMGGFVLLFYIIIHQLENHIIVPKIMQKNVDVSPLVTITVILIGFKMAGMFGALLAVPIYILLRNLYSFWVRESAA